MGEYKKPIMPNYFRPYLNEYLWVFFVFFSAADDVVLADLERIPTPDSGLPVIGDRYSNILHDIPVSYTLFSSIKVLMF